MIPIAGGAHPSSCSPHYGFDVPHFKEYAPQQKGGFASYADKYIHGKTEIDYQNLVGGLESIKQLPLAVY